jgi:hypothetical protein
LGLDVDARVGKDGRLMRVAGIGRKPKGHCKRLTVATEDHVDPEQMLHELWPRGRGAFRELAERDQQAPYPWLEGFVRDAEDILAEFAPEIDVGSEAVQQPDGSVGRTGRQVHVPHGLLAVLGHRDSPVPSASLSRARKMAWWSCFSNTSLDGSSVMYSDTRMPLASSRRE